MESSQGVSNQWTLTNILFHSQQTNAALLGNNGHGISQFSVFIIMRGKSCSFHTDMMASLVPYHIRSTRAKDDLLIAAVSGSKGSSLFVHIIKYNGQHINEIAFASSVNTAPTTDVNVSMQLDLIVSKSSIVCTTKLPNPATKVFAFPSCYTMVICNMIDEGKEASKIIVFNMMCHKISSYISSKITVATKMQIELMIA